MAEQKQKKNVRVVLILIDGVADLGFRNLMGQTILQYYDYPMFNALAASGLNGVIDPVETGLACGSDTAHMNIFGYNPFEEYRGRGSFEAMGSGIPMEFNEVAFKSNFAHMDPATGIVKLRRVDRNFPEWGLPLIDEVVNGLVIPGFEEYKVTCKWATEHRVGVKVTGPKLTNAITGTDPLKDNLLLRTVKPKDDSEESQNTAKVVNALAKALFDKLTIHPINKAREEKGLPTANTVLLRGCGSRLKVDSFEKKHGMKGFFIAPTAIINGLGQTIGVDTPIVEGATGDYHSNHMAKGEKAIELLGSGKYDFGFVHIKAVDDAGHDKSFDKKVFFCKRVDEMMKLMVEKANSTPGFTEKNELVIALTGDHSTPLVVGDHTFEPVPFAVSTLSSMNQLMKGLPETKMSQIRDDVRRFNEIDSARGALGRFSGAGIMKVVKSLRNVLENLQ